MDSRKQNIPPVMKMTFAERSGMSLTGSNAIVDRYLSFDASNDGLQTLT